MIARAVLVVSLLASTPGAAAGPSHDAQMDDLDEQDRRYLERLERARESPEATGGSREEVVAAYLDRAEELIHDRNFASEETEHHRVATDDPRLDVEAAGALLESFHAFFAGVWPSAGKPEQETPRNRVYLFWSFFKYNRLLTGSERFGEFRPSGHYRRFFDVVSIHTDGAAPEDLPDLLIHEAAHQAVERRLFPEEARPPLWVAEGLATYYGHTERREDGTFVVGGIGGKSISLIRGEKPGKGSPSARRRLREAKRAVSTGGFRVEDLLRTDDPAKFYGRDAQTYYGTSWLLVHFLLHGDDGSRAAGFARYLEAEAKGEGGVDVLLRETGLDLPRLESAFASYVRRL